MKRISKWMFLLFALVLAAGCAPEPPPIFRLIKLYQQNKHDDAIALAEKLIAENPDDAQAHRFLVKSVRAKDELEKYEEKYKRLVSEHPNTAGYRFGLGYIYTQLEKYDDSIPELKKAAELNPSIEYVHYVMGWTYLHPGYSGYDADKGLVDWKKEEELNPKSLGALQVYNDRADYYLRIGDSDAAEKDYEKITLYAFAPGDVTRARSYISQIRMLRDEMAQLEADVKDNPDDPELRLKLGVVQYKNGKVDNAIETWQKTLELAPDNVDVRNYLGKALLEEKLYSEAAEQFKKVIELDSNTVTAYYNLAVAEEFLGEPGQALENYKKYVELNPMAPKLEEVKQRIAILEQQAEVNEG